MATAETIVETVVETAVESGLNLYAAHCEALGVDLVETTVVICAIEVGGDALLFVDGKVYDQFEVCEGTAIPVGTPVYGTCPKVRYNVSDVTVGMHWRKPKLAPLDATV